jgi:Protein of unknown function (DUF4240)
MPRLKVALHVGSALLSMLTVGGCVVYGGSGASPDGIRATSPARPVEPMNNRDFWQLIAESRRDSADADVDQAQALKGALQRLDTAGVATFQRAFVQASQSLYTWKVAAASDLVCGSLGDDLFTDFRSWVIAHGEHAYERVVENPDALAEFEDLDDGCGAGEPFGFAASEVYADKSGRNAWDDGLPILEPSTQPAGERIDGDAALRAAFPMLFARE